MTQRSLLSLMDRDPCFPKHGGVAASVEAHERILPVKARQCAEVLQLIREAGSTGATSKEVAERMKVGLNRISGRFTELEKAGLIRAVGQRDGARVWIARAKGEKSD